MGKTGNQLSFATLDYAAKKKLTKRDVFLAEMAAAVPWAGLEAVIEPHYPKMGPQGGRRAFPLSVMLRIYCLQQWYQLSDPGAEEALYDIQSMRMFAGLELGRDAIPDETTILNFRHLLERHDLTKAIFAAVAEHLERRGALLRGGTIVDATLIAASPSTKNKEQKRDPEMRQSKKGNQWYFGMKVHVGTDASSGLVHTGGVTAGGAARRGALGGQRKSQARAETLGLAQGEEQALRQGARESRTRVPGAEVSVRISKSALQRDQKERRASLLSSRSRQHLPRKTDSDGGVTASAGYRSAGQRFSCQTLKNRQETNAKPRLIRPSLSRVRYRGKGGG